MPVKVRCPQCSKDLAAPDAARGKAIRCPDCQTKIAVPNASSTAASPSVTKSSATRPAASSGKSPARKPAPKPDPEETEYQDDDFLSGLDLRHAEDRTARICAKCGKPVSEYDEECPYCGMDTRTGQMTAITRKRMTLKGPDPDEFGSTAWKDPWAFTLENKSLWLRTIGYSALMYLLYAGCMYMSLMMSQNLPPRLFWLAFAIAVALVIPGWYFHLQMILIQRTMSKKNDAGTVHFDAFQNMALGLKVIFWYISIMLIPSLLFGLPVFFARVFLGSLIANILWYSVVLLFSPLMLVGITHLAMPITWKGWSMPMLFRPFFKTFGRTMYVWIILLVVNFVPVTFIGAGNLIFTWNVQKPYFKFYSDPQFYMKEYEDQLKKLEEQTRSKRGEPEPTEEVKKSRQEKKDHLKELIQRIKERSKDLEDEELITAHDKMSGFRNLDWSRPKFGDAGTMKAYDLRFSWWMWMLGGSALWFTGIAMFAFTGVFSMRLIGQYAYFFNEPLELVVEPPEEEFVRMLPHRATLITVMVIFAGISPFLGSIIGGIATRMAKFDLEDMKTGRRDPKGRKATKRALKIALGFSIFWTIVSIYFLMAWSFGIFPFGASAD